MMIPSIVRKERILLPQMLLKAILNDCSIFLYISVKIDLPVMDPDNTPGLHGNGAVMGNHDDGVALVV